MVRFMVKKNTREMPTISRSSVILKRLLPIQDYHMLQLQVKRKQLLNQHQYLKQPLNLLPKLQVHQPLSLLVQQVSHILLVLTTTQELPLWTQMLWFGKEPTSMMVKSMGTRRETTTRTISKNTVMTKRPKLTLESHTLPPLSKLVMHQLRLQKMQQVYHMQMTKVFTTQMHQKWIQMPRFGKEKTFTMVKSMVKKIGKCGLDNLWIMALTPK